MWPQDDPRQSTCCWPNPWPPQAPTMRPGHLNSGNSIPRLTGRLQCLSRAIATAQPASTAALIDTHPSSPAASAGRGCRQFRRRRSPAARRGRCPYGSNIQLNRKWRCFKRWDLPAAGRLWPETGRYRRRRVRLARSPEAGRSSRSAAVSVMKAANLRLREHSSLGRRLDLPLDWSVARQRQVGIRLYIGFILVDWSAALSEKHLRGRARRIFSLGGSTMEIVLATVGSILLLLFVGGGVLMKTKLVKVEEPVPTGDRIAAGLIGISLILIAAAVKVEAPARWLWIFVGFAVFITVAYAIFLWLTRPRKKTDTHRA